MKEVGISKKILSHRCDAHRILSNRSRWAVRIDSQLSRRLGDVLRKVIDNARGHARARQHRGGAHRPHTEIFESTRANARKCSALAFAHWRSLAHEQQVRSLTHTNIAPGINHNEKLHFKIASKRTKIALKNTEKQPNFNKKQIANIAQARNNLEPLTSHCTKPVPSTPRKVSPLKNRFLSHLPLQSLYCTGQREPCACVQRHSATLFYFLPHRRHLLSRNQTKFANIAQWISGSPAPFVLPLRMMRWLLVASALAGLTTNVWIIIKMWGLDDEMAAVNSR